MYQLISYDTYQMLHMISTNFHLHISMAPFKSQLIHFSSITAPHTKHETFLNQKLDLVEVLLRLVSILILSFFAARRPNRNQTTSFSQKWHVECGILIYQQIQIRLLTVQTQKPKERLQSKNSNLGLDFMQIC